MTFKNFLSEIGTKAKDVFAWLGSSQGQTEIAAAEGAATAITTAINPAAGAALTGIESLINNAFKQVVSTEALAAAAAAQSGTGAQKAVAVAAAVAPQVSSILQSLGVKAPAATQVQSISTVVASSLANIVNAFPSSTTIA